MKTTYTPSQPPACSKAATPIEASVAEALARGDLTTLPRVGGPTQVSGLMEILLGAYDRLAREPNEHPKRSGTATASPHHGGSKSAIDSKRNDSMLSFNVRESSGPPAGLYSAEFVGVEETNHEQYGPGAIFKFKITAGEHAGKIATRTCKPEATTGNVTGKLLAGLLGGQFKPGDVSLESCVGRKYTIVVGLAKDGQRTRVESVMVA